MMTVANLGVLAGLTDSEIERDILQHAKRKPTDAELADTIEEARATAGSETGASTSLSSEEKARLKEKRKHEREVLKVKGRDMAIAAVKELAGDPIALDKLAALSRGFDIVPDWQDFDIQRRNAGVLLQTLYRPEELIFTGGELETGKRTLDTPQALASRFAHASTLPPFLITNPFTGERAERSPGKWSYRCDKAIAAHRYCLYESDIVDLELQAAFLASRIAAGWPIVSVVWSGGKSLHALLRVDVANAAQWQAEITDKLFPVLAGLGADRACGNPARLTRLPGGPHKSGRIASLVYLNTELGEGAIHAGVCDKKLSETKKDVETTQLIAESPTSLFGVLHPLAGRAVTAEEIDSHLAGLGYGPEAHATIRERLATRGFLHSDAEGRHTLTDAQEHPQEAVS
jgi:hypothetical protein